MLKGILKYGIYGAAGLWLFALGVMVGRGTAPVSFDTRGFQARLQAIAREYGRQAQTREKVDLKFYDALNEPVRHEVKDRSRSSGEIVPGRQRPAAVSAPPEETGGEDAVPVKVGKKQTSMNRELMAGKRPVPSPEPAAPVADKARKKAALKPKPPGAAKARSSAGQTAGKTIEQPGKYTIQVAAYKAFKDAVSQMAALEEKGIPSYRVKREKDGAVWYRVRTGSFADYTSAKARLAELKKVRVDGMIIKKE